MAIFRKIIYFDSPGRQNTDETLRAAKERAIALGIKDIVVASTSGATGMKACRAFEGFNLIIVRHHTGYEEPGQQQMLKENEEKIISSNVRLVTMSHSLSGVERAIRFKMGTYQPLEIISEVLRLFGPGVKVCMEISVMAADAGVIPIDKDIIAIAGSGGGSDTALVIHPAHSNNFFDMFVREIITKPRERKKD